MPAWELALVLALAVVVLCGAVVFGLWISRRALKEREIRVRRVNAVFRAVADRRGDTFVPGGTHDHPLVGLLEYSGRVRGQRGRLVFSVTFTEGGSDDSEVLAVTVASVRTRRRRLTRTSNDLSREARALVLELLDRGHQIQINRPFTSAEKDVNDLAVTLNAAREDPLNPETLDALVAKTVALAGSLEQDPRGTPSAANAH